MAITLQLQYFLKISIYSNSMSRDIKTNYGAAALNAYIQEQYQKTLAAKAASYSRPQQETETAPLQSDDTDDTNETDVSPAEPVSGKKCKSKSKPKHAAKDNPATATVNLDGFIAHCSAAVLPVYKIIDSIGRSP